MADTTDLTISDVRRFIRDPGLREMIVDALNAQARQKRAQAKAGFRPGMKVTFFSTRVGRHVTGTVQKVNRVNIDLTEDSTNTRWRVSPQLLKRA